MNKSLENYRLYGDNPYSVVLVHGGPGAAGEMKPVAENLKDQFGIIEPFQTKFTIWDQVLELKEQIISNTKEKVTLVGWSWGAWLSYIFAASFPDLVEKLILISSAPFEESYVEEIKKARESRITKEQLLRLQKINERLMSGTQSEKNNAMKEAGAIFNIVDSFEIDDMNDSDTKVNFKIYKNIWNEASAIRKNGVLLEYAEKIKCPVTAIHGFNDPHPYQGVKSPFKHRLNNFKFFLLEQCGHHPWYEKHSKDEFFKILKNEIQTK